MLSKYFRKLKFQQKLPKIKKLNSDEVTELKKKGVGITYMTSK